MHVAEPPPPWYRWSLVSAELSFIDSNILVYADSDDEPAKQQKATLLLSSLHKLKKGVISTQVLNEYTNVGLKKLKLAYPRLRSQLKFYNSFEVVTVTPQITDQAVDLHQTRSLRFYDALLVTSASLAWLHHAAQRRHEPRRNHRRRSGGEPVHDAVSLIAAVRPKGQFERRIRKMSREKNAK